MKKSALLFAFVIGLFLVISGWGLVPQLYAAPVEIKLGHVDPAGTETHFPQGGSGSGV